MKNLIICLFLLFTILGSAYFWSKNLREENARLKSNQELLLFKNNALLVECQKYKVADSLSALKTTALELTVKEYKDYNKESLKLINQLKSKNMSIQGIVETQLLTINTLATSLKDTIHFDTTTSQIDTLRYFNYCSKWCEVQGYLDLKKDTVNLRIKNKEELKVVETVQYKRFLGFLWKTSKIKKRQVDVVSLNPNTEIMSCEYISIKK